jgi:hypothetical protein
MDMNQSTPEFLKKRRQPYLTEAYFTMVNREEVEVGIPLIKEMLAEPKSSQRQKGIIKGLARSYIDLLHLRYTAGYPIEQLAQDLDEVVSAWEDFAKVQRDFKKQNDYSAFSFAVRVDYNEIILLIGIAILLCRTDLLPRINALCYIYRGDDFLYDELLYPFVDGHIEADEYTFFHEHPYESLIDLLESEDPAEQASIMKQAVEDWYPDNEGEPFHDTHKQISVAVSGGYFGYWCFELAALSVILNIDDTSFKNHITYPKDLADYCHTHLDLTKPALSANATTATQVRVDAGKTCPQEGYYFTPSKVGSRRLFKNGETMPELSSGAWVTIWQWDVNQD